MTRKKKFVKFLGVNSLKCTVFHFGSGLLPVYKLKGPCTQNRDVLSLSYRMILAAKKKKKNKLCIPLVVNLSMYQQEELMLFDLLFWVIGCKTLLLVNMVV